MLKFHTNDTTFLATFEDFITTVFVMIDDLYRRYAPPEVAKRRHALDAKLSDSEIITVSLCGELAGIDSENARYSLDNREGLRDLVDGQSGIVVKVWWPSELLPAKQKRWETRWETQEKRLTFLVFHDSITAGFVTRSGNTWI